MKLIYLLIIAFLSFSLPAWSQYTISGNVADAQSGSPVIHASVEAASIKTITGDDGHFTLQVKEPGDYTLLISLDGYDMLSLPFKLGKGPTDLGTLSLKPSLVQSESGISDITLSGESDDKDQAVSGLLHSSGDVFVNAASYAFGGMFFRMRGYDSEYENVYMEGAPVNDAESGRAVFGEWGGLNDVVRNREFTNGIEPSKFSIGSLGGTSLITTRASMQRKQVKFSYALSNRSYTNRAMLTYSTGLMKNNWAFTASASRRWSQKGYVEGTFYDAYAYFVGAEKKINSKHSLAFTAFASPTRRGQSTASTQEVYDLMGSNYYNANWGYQNGEIRNARVKTSNEPMMILSHYWTLNDKTSVTTSLSYSFGKTGTTSLNWYNANDPRPDYYRNLPNYQADPKVPVNPLVHSALVSAWQNDANVSQINWDRLYQVNHLSNRAGQQANYIIENNISATNQWYLNSRINKKTGTNSNFSGGIELTHYKGSHYKELDDLLGGKYWLDIDQFSQRDFKADTTKLQNDLNNPNSIINEGDRFGYDYALFSNNAKLWALEQYTFARVDFYLGASIASTQYWREGYMRNGRSPENSFGKSSINSNFNYNLKAGGTYKLSGRHYITANVAYITRPPLLRDAYISPRTSANLAGDLSDEKVLSGDLSYVVRYPNFNARITLYETVFKNHNEIIRYYHDELLTFVNQVLSNEDRIHQGIEFGAESKINDNFKVVGVASIGNFRYTNNPKGTINYDNGSLPDTAQTVYMKNFFVGGTPQFASHLALKFNKNYWFIEVSGSYYDKMWLDFTPIRRTEAAIEGNGPGDPKIKLITDQQKLKGGFTLDASIGKSIRVKSYFINLNLSVSNILNNTSLISGGYEQNRFDFANNTMPNLGKFPPKYYYAYGTTYFLNIGFRL
ncbi:MAG: carboxypeptidase regulatory-like domain-containing protein [Bacteroidota bacterium]